MSDVQKEVGPDKIPCLMSMGCAGRWGGPVQWDPMHHGWWSHGDPPLWTDRHDWKHYLPATSLAGGNMSNAKQNEMKKMTVLQSVHWYQLMKVYHASKFHFMFSGQMYINLVCWGFNSLFHRNEAIWYSSQIFVAIYPTMTRHFSKTLIQLITNPTESGTSSSISISLYYYILQWITKFVFASVSVRVPLN